MSSPPSTHGDTPAHLFKAGDKVAVKIGYPSGHCRTPFYVRGKHGFVERVCGAFRNPETLAYGQDGNPKHVLYRVRFDQSHVWSNYKGPAQDTIEIEIYEHWLEAVS